VKQETIAGLLLGTLNNANLVMQAAVDEAITNLIISAVLPLRIVELRGTYYNAAAQSSCHVPYNRETSHFGRSKAD